MQTVSRFQIVALAFALTFPSLLTFAYFVLLSGQGPRIPQLTYALGKTIQFVFPIAWMWWVMGERPVFALPRRDGLLVSLVFGMLIATTMYALYIGWLRSSPVFSEPAQIVRQKIGQLGVDSYKKYLALGVFYALAHSLLEEYYWRWFVFGQLRRRLSSYQAIFISSVGFMAHHVILLAAYFGWDSPLAYFFSLCVGVGGAIWAWIYERSGSLYGPWWSHCLVDAAIFVIGYDVARELLGG